MARERHQPLERALLQDSVESRFGVRLALEPAVWDGGMPSGAAGFR